MTDQPSMQEIGSALRLLRERTGLDQKEVASLAGVKTGSNRGRILCINRRRLTHRIPSHRLWIRYSAALDRADQPGRQTAADSGACR